MFSIVSALSFSENKIKDKISMNDLNTANESLNKLEDKDVRIIYLPPMTVAAAYATGEGCEGLANDIIKELIEENQLLKTKPDARSFGFDCSKGEAEVGQPSRAYEAWVSIPETVEVKHPLVKRNFNGGLYAAHVLRNWDFKDWILLKEWVDSNDKYDNDWGTPRYDGMETLSGEGFEETLNFYNFIEQGSKMEDLQLDLLFPIKIKS